MEMPTGHSPVGGSAAKRIIACPASVILDPSHDVDDESDHAALGTVVHSLIEYCFSAGTDAWRYIGSDSFTSLPVTKSMANGAQVMLDEVRKAHPDRNQGNFWVERKFHRPNRHPLYHGTADVVHLDEVEVSKGDGGGTFTWKTLHIWDYKNGAGVVVEAKENEQGMYYACGILDELNLWHGVDEVAIHIVQPNAWHADGIHRRWFTTPHALVDWLNTVMVPAIVRAMDPDSPREAVTGEHCRFCPKRFRTCPGLMAEMEELETMIDAIVAHPDGTEMLSNEQLGRFLDLFDRAKIVATAAGQAAFKRIQGGGRVPGRKLVPARANRVFHEELDGEAVTVAAKGMFGADAFVRPALKSPAQMEELPGGTNFVQRWAYKPDAGLTLAPNKDARPEVSRDTKALFQPVEPPAPAAPAILPPPARRRKTA